MINKSQNEIMKKWKAFENPLVTIRCLAYNQEEYIGNTIDSFLNQITDFPFEIIIHEDASTDNTAKIIKRYEEKFPLIVKPIYEKENQYSKETGIMDPKMKGKYIALCEGDDYWIDTNKLQMQVDFLENNEDYVMSYTDFNIYYERKKQFEYNLFKSQPNNYPKEVTLQEWILHPGYMAPMTWLIRKSVWDTIERENCQDGTYVMYAHFLRQGKLKCHVDRTTAVYRVLPESAAHTSNLKKHYERLYSLFITREKLVEKYGLDLKLKDEIKKQFYLRTYKHIGLLNLTDQEQLARYYCRGIKYDIFFGIVHISCIRNILCVLYKIFKKCKG